MTNRLWFKAKTYGWGWSPATWEGWVVVGVYVGLLAVIVGRMEGEVHSARETLTEVTVPIVVITAALIAISYWKGERLGWRWGKE